MQTANTCGAALHLRDTLGCAVETLVCTQLPLLSSCRHTGCTKSEGSPATFLWCNLGMLVLQMAEYSKQLNGANIAS